MTPERFQALLDAYGADPLRWPADERAAAQAFATDAARQQGADAVAARSAGWRAAVALDDMLAQHRVAPASSRLCASILASAPVARMPRAEPRMPWRRWWPGVGIAGVGAAGLAGVVAGMLAVSVLAGGAPGGLANSPQTTAFATRDWPYATSGFTGAAGAPADQAISSPDDADQ